MKLDPRIKSLSDILTPFDTERAKELIGQKGFFANGIEFFRDGEPHCVYGTLTRVFGHQDQTDPYLKMEGGDLYSFFLPESSLKPEEKLLGGRVEKLVYHAVSVPLSKDEIELLIEGLCDISITNKRAICLYQKLAKKLEALEGDGRKDEVL